MSGHYGQPFTDLSQVSMTTSDEEALQHERTRVSPSRRAQAYAIPARSEPPPPGVDIQTDLQYSRGEKNPYGQPLVTPGALAMTGQAPVHSTDDDTDAESGRETEMTPDEMRDHIAALQGRRDELQKISMVLNALMSGQLSLDEFGSPEEQQELVAMLEMYGHSLLAETEDAARTIQGERPPPPPGTSPSRAPAQSPGSRTTGTSTSTSTQVAHAGVGTDAGMVTIDVPDSESSTGVEETEDDWSETGFTTEDTAANEYEAQETSLYAAAREQARGGQSESDVTVTTDASESEDVPTLESLIQTAAETGVGLEGLIQMGLDPRVLQAYFAEREAEAQQAAQQQQPELMSESEDIPTLEGVLQLAAAAGVGIEGLIDMGLDPSVLQAHFAQREARAQQTLQTAGRGQQTEPISATASESEDVPTLEGLLQLAAAAGVGPEGLIEMGLDPRVLHAYLSESNGAVQDPRQVAALRPPPQHQHQHQHQHQQLGPVRTNEPSAEEMLAAAAAAGIDLNAIAQNVMGVDPKVVQDVTDQISSLQALRDDIANLRQSITEFDNDPNSGQDPMKMMADIQSRMAQVAEVSQRIQQLESQLDSGRLAAIQMQDLVGRLGPEGAAQVASVVRGGPQIEPAESDDGESVPSQQEAVIQRARDIPRPSTRGGTGEHLDRTSDARQARPSAATTKSPIRSSTQGRVTIGSPLGGRGKEGRPSSAPAAPVDPRFGKRQHRAAMLAELASAKARQEEQSQQRSGAPTRDLSNDALDQYVDDRQTPSPDLEMSYPARPAAPTPSQSRPDQYDRTSTPSPSRLTRPQAPTPLAGSHPAMPSNLSSPAVSRPQSTSPRTASSRMSFHDMDEESYLNHLEGLLEHSRVSLEDLKLAVLYSSRLPKGPERAVFFSTFFQYFENLHGGRAGPSGDNDASESESVTVTETATENESESGDDQYSRLSRAYQIRPGTAREVDAAVAASESEDAEASSDIEDVMRSALGEEWQDVLLSNAQSPEFLLNILMEVRRMDHPRVREQLLFLLKQMNESMLEQRGSSVNDSYTTMTEDESAQSDVPTERTLDSAAENALERAIDEADSESDVSLVPLDSDLRVQERDISSDTNNNATGRTPQNQRTTAKAKSAGANQDNLNDSGSRRMQEFRSHLRSMEQERLQTLRQNYFIHNLTQLDSPNKVPSSTSSSQVASLSVESSDNEGGAYDGPVRRSTIEHDYSETADESEISLPTSQLESADSNRRAALDELNEEYSAEIMENEVIVQAFHQKICSLWAQKESARQHARQIDDTVDSSSAGGDDQGLTSASTDAGEPVRFDVQDIVDLSKRVTHLVSQGTNLMDTPLRKAIRQCTSRYLGSEIGKYKDDLVQDVSDLLYDQMIFQKVVDHVTRSYNADIDALQTASGRSAGREIAALKAQRDQDIKKLQEERMQRLAMDNDDDALHRQDKDMFTTPSVWMQRYREALSLAQREPVDSGASTSSGTGEMDMTDNSTESEGGMTTDDMVTSPEDEMPSIAQLDAISREMDQVMTAVQAALSPNSRALEEQRLRQAAAAARKESTTDGETTDFTDDSLTIRIADLPDAPLNIPDAVNLSFGDLPDISGPSGQVIEFSEQEPDSSFAVESEPGYPPDYQDEAREHIEAALAEVTDSESEAPATSASHASSPARRQPPASSTEPAFVSEARAHIEKALAEDTDDEFLVRAKHQLTAALNEIEDSFGLHDHPIPHPDDHPVGAQHDAPRSSTLPAGASPARRAFVDQLREVEEQYASLGLKDVATSPDFKDMRVEPDRFMLARKTSDTIRAELAERVARSSGGFDSME